MRLVFGPAPMTVDGFVRAGWLRSAFALALCGLGAAIGVAVGTVLLVLNLRQHALDDRMSDLESATQMLSAHADSALQALESVQTGLIDQMRSTGITTEERYVALMATAEVQRTLQDRVSALLYVNAVTLIDRRGDLLNFSRYWPIPRVNVADRDYFKALSSDRQSNHFVSEPVQNRGTGAWTAYIGRRFNAPDGSLLGLVLGAIELSYFQQFFNEVAPNQDTVISMFRNDGVMLLRQPPADQVIGRTLPTAAVRILMSGSNHGTIRGVSPVDGQDRLVAIHGLAHYPIVVSMSRTAAATLRPWREQMHYFVTVAAAIVLSLAGIVLLGIRHLRNRHLLADAVSSRVEAQAEQAAAEERERNGQRLAAYYSRFDTAVSNMSQGLCMFDAADRLIISNPRLTEIFDLPASALAAGISFTLAARAAIRARGITSTDIRFVRPKLMADPGMSRRGALIWDLSDGRALSISFERMTEQGWLMTFEDITERRRTEAQIAYMARHDALTGLPNRTLFHERLVTAVGLAARGAQHGVLCLDLDHFKDVNDTLGHPVGDALLQAVTARLQRCVRDTDSVARLGGDEFAVILASVHQPMDAAALADRLIEELSLPYDVAGHQVVIGVSIGIALTPDDGLDPHALLKNADLALYRAKADGRGCHRFFKPEMDAILQARRRMELDLRQAFTRHEFELHYQPLVDLGRERVSGFEALLRWQCPGRSKIGPQEFIPVAEEIGLIIPLGEWVLDTACREAATWPDDIAVAVNLSPVQFRSRHLVSAVQGALDRSGLSPARLELEITETVLLSDTEDTLATLHQLRELGVRISMDDFGTGYSSLSYLLKFPFDKVKIDRSFVRGLGESGDCDAIIRAVTGMCHDLGMTTIAEGVETPAQLAVLQDRNCMEVQGFLFSAAVPGADVQAFLATFEPRILAKILGQSSVAGLMGVHVE